MPATPDPKTAIFVTAAVALNPEGGGVQRCTHEYIAVLEAAGFTLHHAAYPFEHRAWVRVMRRLRPRPYRDAVPRGYADVVRREVRARNAGWILLNQSEAAPMAAELADLRGQGVRIALLSHGTDSCDYPHVARIRADFGLGPAISARDDRWMGRVVFEEQEQHRNVDAVLCLSENDRQQALWLGAHNVAVLPRVVADRAVDWRPVAGRLGTVATLTHEPNYEGIALLCRALAPRRSADLRLRLVGTPEALGRRLAGEFPFVDYLGGLSDAALADEARTWSAFANPMFCYPRGCSTKLAVPLEWRIPVATTRAGARGYVWDETLIPLAETADELASLCLRLADPAQGAEQRGAVATIAARSPRAADLAAIVRDTLR